jgi:hypothetical protein
MSYNSVTFRLLVALFLWAIALSACQDTPDDSATVSNNNETGPDGSGASRLNNILRISCNPQRVCSLAPFDPNILTEFVRSTP